ncbi:MAG: sugar phosphate isomerase/epimerase [Oscillospiraceae bacterium]|nr:sugar phosphate isomerase/epimerase [Oscillospiraceae bacterium]
MIRLSTGCPLTTHPNSKNFFPDNLTERMEVIQQLGFEAYEIDGALVLNQYEDVKKAVKKTNIAISTICAGNRGWIGDFCDYQRRLAVEDITIILERAGELGATGIVVPAAFKMFSIPLAAPTPPPRPPEEDTRVLIDTLSKLEPIAKRTGTKILLEPANRYANHMLNTLAEAKSIIQEGNLTETLVVADFYHMNMEEKSIVGAIEETGALLGHVHLADNNRFQPGEGMTDFVSGFKALVSINYSGYLAFECMVTGIDPIKEYRRSVEYIRERLAEAKLK